MFPIFSKEVWNVFQNFILGVQMNIPRKFCINEKHLKFYYRFWNLSDKTSEVAKSIIRVFKTAIFEFWEWFSGEMVFS